MKRIFRIEFIYHEMLRTKCVNIYMLIFGYRFQVGLYRNYLGHISSIYLGLVISLHFPFNPFRSRFFIPSLFVIKDMAKAWIRYDRFGNYSMLEKLKFSRKSFNYYKSN